MTENSQVLFEHRGSAGFITFNRPEARNAMTWEMYDRLYELCEKVDVDDDIRVIVLRGRGGKAFISGTDIKQFQQFSTGEEGVRYEQRLDHVVGRLETVRVPTIAVIDGYAAGGGLAIASACDLRICTPAAKFGVPIARTLGNCLSMETYARLVALIGPARTTELIYTARFLTSDEAFAAGLATEVIPPDDLDARIDELCGVLSSHAPLTMRATKEAIRRVRQATVPQGADLVSECYSSDDFREGVRAFVEKRRPKWTGR